MEAEPLLKKFPNSHGEATMDEKMVISFFGLLAKGAKAAIIPTALA
jgi:hypothetical protein